MVARNHPHVKRPLGYTLWHGPGPDRKQLALVMSGVRNPSENPKTGPMLQTWLLRADLHPMEAAISGQDSSTCNHCELRPFRVRLLAARLGLRSGQKPPQCYVNLATVAQVWRTYRAGHYPTLAPERFAEVLGGNRIRLGSYGNLSNAPLLVVRGLVEASSGWTMYEHNWRARRAWPLAEFAMASVSSHEDKAEANELGWRTFRVTRSVADVLPDEILCPASPEGGSRLTCSQCRLCQGQARPAKNIAVVDHGPTSPGRMEVLQLGRERLRGGR